MRKKNENFRTMKEQMIRLLGLKQTCSNGYIFLNYSILEDTNIQTNNTNIHISINIHIFCIYISKVTAIVSSTISKTCKQYLKAQRQNNTSRAISNDSKYVISNLKILLKINMKLFTMLKNKTLKKSKLLSNIQDSRKSTS